MENSSNFAFLEVHNPQLATLATLAERYLKEDPNTCLIKLRQYGELLAQQVAAKVGMYISTQEEQYALLRRLEDRGLLQGEAGTLFHQLRKTGNEATHEGKGDEPTALNCLKNAHKLAIWYHRAFGDSNFKPAPFIIPADTITELENQLKFLQDELEAKNLEISENIKRIQAEASSQSTEQVEQTIRQAKQAEESILAMLNGREEDINAPSEGFENFGAKLKQVSHAVGTIATLIGETEETEITLDSGATIKPGLGLTSEAEVLSKRAQDIQQGIFKLIVLGEFKHGKSTLLNAMLGDKKLPAKTTPATAIITMLVYGEDEQVAIHEVNQEAPRLVSWESFVKEFQLGIKDRDTLAEKKFIDRFKNIEYAQIECKNRLCQSGVRLIDSPGLAEHISRTRVTTEFLKQSQAVILVLNATQILTQQEQEFIKTNFRPGGVNNVFFVVNRINLVEEEEVEGLQEYIRDYLKDYYVDEQGKVDKELCDRRLFFVDALSALDARMETPIDEVELEKSGVLALEKELENFLTTNQRFRASMTSTVDFLVAVIDQAHFKITQQQKLLGEPLIFLEKRRLEAEKSLQALTEKTQKIERLIDLYEQKITDKLCSNFSLFINDSRNTWEYDYQEFIPLDQINLINMLISTFNPEHKQKLAKDINEGVQQYIENRFKKWSEKIPIIIDEDFNNLTKDLQLEIQSFAQEIAGIENIFVNGKKTDDFIDLAKNEEDKIIQLLISLLLGDFSQMSGTIMGDGNWSSFIMNSLQQMLMVTAILSIFGGPIEWVFLILAEITQMIMKGERNKKKLAMSLGKKVFEQIEHQMQEIKSQIRESTKNQFQKLSKNITYILQSQIDEVRTEQEKIIKQKQDETFSIEQEKERMEKIEQEVLQLFNQISKLTYGRTYTLEEIQWVAQGKNLMNNGEVA